MSDGRYRIAPEADQDLLDIAFRRALFSATASDRLIGQITKTFETLATNPRMGRARDELAPGLRSFVVGQHVVFYRIITGGIEIARVLHGARNIDAIFGDTPEGD